MNYPHLSPGFCVSSFCNALCAVHFFLRKIGISVNYPHFFPGFLVLKLKCLLGSANFILLYFHRFFGFYGPISWNSQGFVGQCPGFVGQCDFCMSDSPMFSSISGFQGQNGVQKGKEFWGKEPEAL